MHNEWTTLGELLTFLSTYDPTTIIYAGVENLVFDHTQTPFRVVNSPVRLVATPLIIEEQ